MRLRLWRDTVREALPLGDLDVAARRLVDVIAPPLDDDVTLLLARRQASSL